MKAPLLTSIAVVAFSLTLPAANWPGWRGDGTGASSEKSLPQTWDPKTNVKWRVELPERSNSSPIVWGDRVFVNQAEGSKRSLICFDRKDGKKLWQSGTTYADREQTQRDNPYCSATPVTDGERVIVSFGSAGLYCYDFDGAEKWHRDFGKMSHMFGNGSSPVLSGDACIFFFGPDEKARLIAVNKKTGDTLWEAQQPKLDPNEVQSRGGGFGGRPGGDRGAGDGQRPGGGQPRPEGGQPRPEGQPGGGGRGDNRFAFGTGAIIGGAMLAQGDKDADKKLSSTEFAALADAWFDKLDAEKAGKLAQEKFAEKLPDVLPPAQGFGQRPDGAPQREGDQPRREGDRGGRGGGFSPARFVAPGFFTATDTNKDGSLTREEWKGTFAKWFTDWDSDKSGSLDDNKLRTGITAALPAPQFGGGGGPGGGPGGFGGRGGGGGPGGSWSTPLVIKSGDHDEVIMNFPNRLVSFDAKTGKELWQGKGMGGTIYTTPVFGEGLLYSAGSGMGGGSALAVKAGGAEAWKLDRAKSAIGSGVIHEGHLYLISQDGIAECISLADGKSVWSERLRGSGARGSSWSSMLLADGKIYVPNQGGDVFVLRAAPKFEVLATNSVGESTNASLAASNGELFLRTDKALWCFGTK